MATIDPSPAETSNTFAARLIAYVQIARLDHWVKNVFVLPGAVVAVALAPVPLDSQLLARLVIGLIAIGLVASSNYVLNELRDAEFDAKHPTKRLRPVPSGKVKPALAYLEWLLLGILGVGWGAFCGTPFMLTLVVLWGMGCVYNLPPLRSKDLPYVDVLSEAVNNPLRMLAGWFIVGPDAIAPGSLLCSYWMAGCYFMAVKRFAEYRMINSASQAAAYRKSFAFYNEQRLLVSIMFYGSAAMLFLGAFVVRYKLELILSFPLIALVMAMYLSISFKADSAAQAPEKLYREGWLVASVVACAITMTALFFADIPLLHQLVAPTAPTDLTPTYQPR